MSVGQGDAALIHTPGGHWVLVDAGPRGPDTDAGARIVAPFLLRHRITRLSALVLSHAHLDHYGGVESVLRRVAVDLVLEPAVPVPDPGYLALLDDIAARQIRWRPARTGDHFTLDGVSFLVLHPDTAWAGWGEDLNWDSVVLLVRYRGFGALLAGDLGGPAEALLRDRIGEVELLKVGHHGSDGSSATGFLEALRPEAVVVSVGPNRYGHPAPGALRRLVAAGAEVWRTDRQRNITVTVTDSSLTLEGREGRRSYRIRP